MIASHVRAPVPQNEERTQPSLEEKLIKEYLREKGYTLKDLRRLPKDQARRLMVQACVYASLKLAEIESRARFVKVIRWPL